MTEDVESVNEWKKTHSNVHFVEIIYEKCTMPQHVNSVHEGKKPFKCKSCVKDLFQK